MGIKEKNTYGEFYWAMQVEAAEANAKAYEKEMNELASVVIDNLGLRQIIPSEFQAIFSAIEHPAGAFLGEIGGRFVSEVADSTVSQSASPFFDAIRYAAYSKFPTKKMSPPSAITLRTRNKISEEFLNECLRREGFEPIEARFQYDALLPYPSIPELITYCRYHGDPDNVWSSLQEFYNVDARDYPLWNWLSEQRFAAEQLHTLFRRNKISEAQLSTGLAQLGWDSFDRDMQQELGWQIPNAMLLIQGGLIANIDDNQLLKDISLGDIHPDFAKRYFDAVLTKPSTNDIIAYQLRQEPELSSLSPELRKIGIHPDYFNLYKELAQIIPPVGDIITMAVREAFTPDIAARFGQYEDFPQPLAEWAAKKGLSREWSQRYWAAHWSLPSPQQGFDMLHRGVITQDDLNMLLRALDIMPFWRDKLNQIAYNVLTRVDIRRMFQTGVLSEGDVEKAYKEAGYNDRDAKRLTDFTVILTKQTLSKFTSADVISAYANRKIDRGEASRLLGNLGIRSGDIPNIIEAAEYKREWEFTDTQTKAIRNLYKRRTYTKEQAQTELSKLGIPSEQTVALLNQWYYEIKAEEPQLWTSAQTLGFLKKGIITKARANEEFELLGYTAERIAAYMESVTVVTK
jgi:hypothetical protein